MSRPFPRAKIPLLHLKSLKTVPPNLFLMKSRSVSEAREIFDHHNFDHIHSGLFQRLLPLFLALCSSIEAHSLPVRHDARLYQYFCFVDSESVRRGSLFPSFYFGQRIDRSHDSRAFKEQTHPNEWIKDGLSARLD